MTRVRRTGGNGWSGSSGPGQGLGFGGRRGGGGGGLGGGGWARWVGGRVVVGRRPELRSPAGGRQVSSWARGRRPGRNPQRRTRDTGPGTSPTRRAIQGRRRHRR